MKWFSLLEHGFEFFFACFIKKKTFCKNLDLIPLNTVVGFKLDLFFFFFLYLYSTATYPVSVKKINVKINKSGYLFSSPECYQQFVFRKKKKKHCQNLKTCPFSYKKKEKNSL